MIEQVFIISKDHQADKFGHSTTSRKQGFTKGTPQNCWSKALRNMGREVVEITFNDVIFPQKTKELNVITRAFRKLRREMNYKKERKRITNRIADFDIGKSTLIIIVGNFAPFKPAFLAELKQKSNCRVALFHGLSTKWLPSKRIDEYSRISDVTVVNSKANAEEFRAVGAKNVVALPYSAASRKLHIASTLETSERQYEYDVGFVGSLYESLYKNRLLLLKELIDYDLAIWSYEGKYLLDKYDLGAFYKGETTRNECPEVYRKCKIMLNIQGVHMPDGGNLSTFEIPGSGAFQLVDAYRDEWFEEGEEIVRYHSVEDLREKLNYYLIHDNEREKIRRKGFERVKKEHTYEDRFEQLFALIER